MRTYFTLDLYSLSGPAEELMDDKVDEEMETLIKPYRQIMVTLYKGGMVIKSESDDPDLVYEAKYSEQLTNEFLIQTELLDIRKWDPMYYSPAYVGGNDCSWELDYHGLKGEECVRSGRGTYPKEWPFLMELIDMFDGKDETREESVHKAALYTDLLVGHGKDAGSDSNDQGADRTLSGLVQAIDMVNILAAMRMPQDVIAVGVLRSMSAEEGYDPETVRETFDEPVVDLLNEYGDAAGSPPGENRRNLLDSVKLSDSLYYKRLVLAEVLADLIRIKSDIQSGRGFHDREMTRDEIGLYYAEMISVLSVLEKDDRAGVIYSLLVDMYKTVFVAYGIDSIRGTIYQTQGTTAGVMLRRGEYDWHPIQGPIPDDMCPVSKDMALFLADRWRHQADEEIVRDGNKTGYHDVPDLKALKVVMTSSSKKDRKDNKVALTVIRRMVDEGEQMLAALHAGPKELKLIERGDIDDVANIPVSFLGLEDDEGNKMAAVFTSMDEVGEIDDSDIEALPLKTLFRFVKHMDRLDGVIIDPFSDRFFITKEKIAEMLDDLSKETSGM